MIVKRGRQRVLVAFERALGQAVVFDEIARLECRIKKVFCTLRLIGRHAQVKVGHSQRQIVVVALAQLSGEHLCTEEDAGRARVSVIRLHDHVEQVRVVKWRTHQLVVLVHTTLAELVRPLVELRVERTIHADIGTKARIKQSWRGSQIVRVISRVLYENVQTSERLNANQSCIIPIVRQTSVHFECEFKHRIGPIDSNRIDLRVIRVKTGVEAIAAVEPRHPNPLEIVSTARSIADCTTYH